MSWFLCINLRNRNNFYLKKINLRHLWINSEFLKKEPENINPLMGYANPKLNDQKYNKTSVFCYC